MQAKMKLLGLTDQQINEIMELLMTEHNQSAEEEEITKAAIERQQRLKQEFDGVKNKAIDVGTTITSIGSAIMSLGTIINSVKGLISIWSNEDLAPGEKMLQTLLTLGTLLPALVTGYKALQTV
jgi:hypothetical protein